LSAHEREYILLHEQTHIRRGDHLVKITAFLILCLHWFNPLAWLAFLLMGADMEMSCDERVMKELGDDTRHDYSLSLVRIATGRRILISSPLAFGEGGIKERVKRILNFQKPSRLITMVAIVLVVALGVGFAMNRADNDDSPEIPPEIPTVADEITLPADWSGNPDGKEMTQTHPFQTSRTAIEVADLIERNLAIITEPSPLSNPYHYIDAHQVEYWQIVAQGDLALNYLFSVFEQGGQDDLRGFIMASACRDILGIDSDEPIATGQQWYDAYVQR
jgi:hypothetical protein